MAPGPRQERDARGRLEHRARISHERSVYRRVRGFFGARIWRNAEARQPLLADRTRSAVNYERTYYQTASAGRRFSLVRLAREAVCRGARR